MSTVQNLMPFVNKVIEFLPAIDTYEVYLERGMYATVVGVEDDQHGEVEDPCFKLRLSLKEHDAHNEPFELDHSFYDREQNPCLTAREAGVYDANEWLYVGNNFADIFKLVDDSDTSLQLMYQNGNHECSYVKWLEDIAKEKLGLINGGQNG